VEYSVGNLMMLKIPVIAARHICLKRMKAGFGENLEGGGVDRRLMVVVEGEVGGNCV
jgi:hypothetical protein